MATITNPFDYGLRNDGTKKDIGFLGELKRPDGRVSTELSIGVGINGKEQEIPTLVPTLNQEERNYLLSVPEQKIFTANPNLYKQIQQKAVDHAMGRIKQGKSPFYTTGIDAPTANSTTQPALFQPAPSVTSTPAPQPAPAQPTTTQQLVDESKATGRSYLDLYNQYAQKPQYDQTRAESIQRNKNLSILADIIKTVGEGVTTNNGGKPIQRQSVAPTLDANLQGLLDKYQAEASAYKNNQFKYMLQDEVDKVKNAIYERKLAAAEAKNAENRANFKATFEQRGVFHKDDLASKGANLNIAQQKLAIAKYNSLHPHIAVPKDPDVEKNYHIIINGKSTLVPISYINDVASKAKQGADIGAPVLSMQPSEVFAAHWPEFYDYNNGQFVPKGNTAEPQIKDRKGKLYTPVQKPFEITPNIITKKKITGW